MAFHHKWDVKNDFAYSLGLNLGMLILKPSWSLIWNVTSGSISTYYVWDLKLLFVIITYPFKMESTERKKTVPPEKVASSLLLLFWLKILHRVKIKMHQFSTQWVTQFGIESEIWSLETRDECKRMSLENFKHLLTYWCNIVKSKQFLMHLKDSFQIMKRQNER